MGLVLGLLAVAFGLALAHVAGLSPGRALCRLWARRPYPSCPYCADPRQCDDCDEADKRARGHDVAIDRLVRKVLLSEPRPHDLCRCGGTFEHHSPASFHPMGGSELAAAATAGEPEALDVYRRFRAPVPAREAAAAAKRARKAAKRERDAIRTAIGRDVAKAFAKGGAS